MKTIREWGEALRAREVSSEELTQGFLRIIAEKEPARLYWLPQLRDGMSLWYSFFWRKWQDDQMRWLLCKSPSWNASGLRKSLSCKGITVSGYRSKRASDSTGTFFKDDKCGNAEAAGVRNFNSTAK